jgi:hypothetical protein
MQIEFTIAALRIAAALLTIGVLWPILQPLWRRARRTWANGEPKPSPIRTRRPR